jgi:hypothetical protein
MRGAALDGRVAIWQRARGSPSLAHISNSHIHPCNSLHSSTCFSRSTENGGRSPKRKQKRVSLHSALARDRRGVLLSDTTKPSSTVLTGQLMPVGPVDADPRQQGPLSNRGEGARVSRYPGVSSHCCTRSRTSLSAGSAPQPPHPAATIAIDFRRGRYAGASSEERFAVSYSTDCPGVTRFGFGMVAAASAGSDTDSDRR